MRPDRAAGPGPATVSHHLKILVDAGLLHRETRGTWAYYSLVPGRWSRRPGLLGVAVTAQGSR